MNSLGIDIGTSGTKTILMEESGKILAQATEEYPLHAPKPNWSEQDPEDWWSATCATLKQVLAKSAIDPREIKGVGYSGQMHGSVFLDGEGKVVRPCMLWNDGRTVAECEEITRKATPPAISWAMPLALSTRTPREGTRCSSICVFSSSRMNRTRSLAAFPWAWAAP